MDRATDRGGPGSLAPNVLPALYVEYMVPIALLLAHHSPLADLLSLEVLSQTKLMLCLSLSL